MRLRHTLAVSLLLQEAVVALFGRRALETTTEKLFGGQAAERAVEGSAEWIRERMLQLRSENGAKGTRSSSRKTVMVQYVGGNLKAAKQAGFKPKPAPANWIRRDEEDYPQDVGTFSFSTRDTFPRQQLAKRVLSTIPPNLVYLEPQLTRASATAFQALEGRWSTTFMQSFIGQTGAVGTGDSVVVAAEAEAGAEAALAAEAGVTAAICLPCFAIVAAVGAVIIISVAVITGPILAAAHWDKKREHFTKDTVSSMMAIVDANRTTAELIDAVACYNKDYDVSDPSKVFAKTSQKLKDGFLHTDYDCMYLQSPVGFWTRGDGGYQNLAYSYHSDACQFDHSTGDLWCGGRHTT